MRRRKRKRSKTRSEKKTRLHLSMYMRMSLIMTMEVWWSFQAALRVCRKLLLRACSTSCRT